jgi:hypothetical protein
MHASKIKCPHRLVFHVLQTKNSSIILVYVGILQYTRKKSISSFILKFSFSFIREAGALQNNNKSQPNLSNQSCPRTRANLQGAGGLQPPPLQLVYQWKMGRVREKKRWRKEEKWREREEEEETSPPKLLKKVLSLELRKEVLDIRQRLKTKVESVVKFSPSKILSWIRHCPRMLWIY